MCMNDGDNFETYICIWEKNMFNMIIFDKKCVPENDQQNIVIHADLSCVLAIYSLLWTWKMVSL